jgi:hypothetical protein
MTHHPTLALHGCHLDLPARTPTGRTTHEGGKAYYEITDVDQMPPFLLTIAGSSNHWMYLSSTGGLTCGRQSPDKALFPYYTDDKIHDAFHTTGPLTVCRVASAGDGSRKAEQDLWLPFSDRYAGVYETSRRLLKSLSGDEVVFEERNETLGLVFRYSWRFSRVYGFLRTARLRNENPKEVQVEILDGLRNILPAGVDKATQEKGSTLVDAYKLTELHPTTDLAIYSMSSLITDRAEPSEALRASVAWHAGFDDATVLLSENQLHAFQRGEDVEPERSIRGRRGAYLLSGTHTIPAGDAAEWMIVIDTDRDTVAVSDLETDLAAYPSADQRFQMVRVDAARGEDELARLVASADGMQCLADETIVARHYSNVLFNIMRGGIFAEGYTIRRDDFLDFLATRNRSVREDHAERLERLPDRISYQELLAMVEEIDNPQLRRLSSEYLPLMFSRRHGDPSRPWNRFSIDIEKPDGSKRLSWQGNWRDIFQNWEALGISYPRFVPAMIATFLNASTSDGYNPYRVSRDGIDWEVHDPDDPWSNIGYWGDHQVVYLWRLLALAKRYQPERLDEWINRPLFSSSAVPYRIKPFDEILHNPYDSIEFDDEAARVAAERVQDVGADGKLVYRHGAPHLVTLAEKLLVLVLAKLSNYVPDGGIWMNTQRPEWNDANNALAGWGISMVTLAYLRGFIDFVTDMLSGSSEAKGSVGMTGDAGGIETASTRSKIETVTVSAGVVRFLREVAFSFTSIARANGPLSPKERMNVMTALGTAGTNHRRSVYDGSVYNTNETVRIAEIQTAFATIAAELDATIATNWREDGLYHSYNVLHVDDDGATIGRLPVMLEGQVAVLGASLLNPQATDRLLSALRDSPLYRPDARSYTLYPDKTLPTFLEKNVVSEDDLASSPWLQREAARADGRVVKRDKKGIVRFNAAFRNARDVEDALQELAEGPDDPPSSVDKAATTSVYEKVFNHRSFTGRSGTFFKYEGLGSIYWHMVSKLDLAVLEAIGDASNSDLRRWYYEIKEGIGAQKTPTEYGAFPFDPYSHTPSFLGAQQPGMTGQVKEDVIARFGELGVVVTDGRIAFTPRILRRDEFLLNAETFRYLDVRGEWCTRTVPSGSLAFTYAQVPVVYTLGKEWALTVSRRDGTTTQRDSSRLSSEESREVCTRSGAIVEIEVTVPESAIFSVG